jgi:hypothetical protein
MDVIDLTEVDLLEVNLIEGGGNALSRDLTCLPVKACSCATVAPSFQTLLAQDGRPE